MEDTGKRLCRRPGCTKQTMIGDMVGDGSGGGGNGDRSDNGSVSGLCAKHATEDISALPLPRKNCHAPGGECKVRPFYGVLGSGNPLFCARHSFDGLVDLRATGKSKSRSRSGKTNAGGDGDGDGDGDGNGNGGSKEVAVTATSKTTPSKTTPSKNRSGGGRRGCSDPGCPTRPTYGWKGSTTRYFCSKHATLGMVDVATKRCV